MSPRPASIMWGTAARIGHTVPAMFVSSIAANSASELSRMPPYIPTPLFATSASRRPKRSSAVSTSRWLSAGTRTSIVTAATRSGDSASSWSRRSRRRAPTTTRAPAPISSRAVARPIPALAPVMTTTWSWSDSIRLLRPCCSAGVQRLGVTRADCNARPRPIRVSGDEAFVVDRDLRFEVSARVAVGELVEPRIGLVGLHHGQLREADPGRLDRLRCPDAEPQPADGEGIGRRAATEVDVGCTLERADGLAVHRPATLRVAFEHEGPLFEPT